jgi:hypothetical protein
MSSPHNIVDEALSAHLDGDVINQIQVQLLYEVFELWRDLRTTLQRTLPGQKFQAIDVAVEEMVSNGGVSYVETATWVELTFPLAVWISRCTSREKLEYAMAQHVAITEHFCRIWTPNLPNSVQRTVSQSDASNLILTLYGGVIWGVTHARATSPDEFAEPWARYRRRVVDSARVHEDDILRLPVSVFLSLLR